MCIVNSMNKNVTNTLDYKEVLLKLSNAIRREATKYKLNQFADVTKKESIILIQIISIFDNNIQSKGHQTDHLDLFWVARLFTDTKNMQAILACLIKA